MLLAELDALVELFRLGGSFKWVINLSATAYPIKTKSEMRRTLASWNGTNHMELFKQEEKNMDSRGTRSWFVECEEEERVFRMPAVKPTLSGIGMYGGSQWFVLQRDFVQEVTMHLVCPQTSHGILGSFAVFADTGLCHSEDVWRRGAVHLYAGYP